MSVVLHIFNIKDGKPADKPGFLALKARIEELRPLKNTSPLVRVKVGGGDGTVMWCFTELLAHEINPDDVGVGVIPFGTGNDFSRTLGWGGSPPKTLIGKERCALIAHIKEWMKAQVVDFDLWAIELETHVGGGFLFVNGKKKDLTDGNRAQHNIKEDGGKMSMSKPMCNYYSIGYDGRAGLGFDKNRTKSALLNLGVYGWEGLKKYCCSRPPPIRDCVDKIESVDSAGNVTMVATSEHKANSTGPTFIGSPIDLIYLNIPSYSKGCDPWSGAGRLAVTKDGKKLMDVNERTAVVKDPQIIGDHKLSAITYTGIFSMSQDILRGQLGCHGVVHNARRLGQTEGGSESVIHFRSKETLNAKKGRVYMQIDGEFFVVEYPAKVTIKHMRTVKVLLSPRPFQGGCCSCIGCGKKPAKYHPTNLPSKDSGEPGPSI
eukprot:GEMP01015141.1.p1 GENE.GEMP01015141.1~~GEMP01015141.1.p1  ORF type:complete len:432 (-),score=73.68 GEMP01015141.1:1504-2799(-)